MQIFYIILIIIACLILLTLLSSVIYAILLIMRRPAFDRYCEWLFGIIFELEKRLDITDYDERDRRWRMVQKTRQVCDVPRILVILPCKRLAHGLCADRAQAEQRDLNFLHTFISIRHICCVRHTCAIRASCVHHACVMRTSCVRHVSVKTSFAGPFLSIKYCRMHSHTKLFYHKTI